MHARQSTPARHSKVAAVFKDHEDLIIVSSMEYCCVTRSRPLGVMNCRCTAGTRGPASVMEVHYYQVGNLIDKVNYDCEIADLSDGLTSMIDRQWAGRLSHARIALLHRLPTVGHSTLRILNYAHLLPASACVISKQLRSPAASDPRFLLPVDAARRSSASCSGTTCAACLCEHLSPALNPLCCG